MIVAKHIGRLGNNMFQIAAAIGYAKKYGYKWAADYGKGLGEPYSCIHKVFNLPKSELQGRKYHEHKDNSFCRVHNLPLDICHFDYHPIPDLGENVNLFGFFQSEKYFEGFHDEVRNAFPIRFEDSLSGYTSIHVRRGDYVKHANSFPPVTIEYVESAMATIRTGKYLVFSDDLEWCKMALIHLDNSQQRIDFFEESDELMSLEAMTSCEHHIIANSSFSWWGAWLGKNPDRMVISPSVKRGNWFGLESGVKKDASDLIPSSWIQIAFR